jgi:hypothetical protein
MQDAIMPSGKENVSHQNKKGRIEWAGPPISDEGHILWPHLVEVHSVTISFNEGHILGPHLVEVCCMIKSLNTGHIFGPH